MRTILMLSAAMLSAAIPASSQTMQTGKKVTLLYADRSWLGEPYKSYPSGTPQLTMLKITIAPHTALPWHTHAFPNAGYVLSGTLTVQDKSSGKTKIVHAGEAFAETVGSVHRGVAGNEPTIILITYSGAVGQATSTPVQGGLKEY